jgi:hypothetical protein
MASVKSVSVRCTGHGRQCAAGQLNYVQGEYQDSVLIWMTFMKEKGTARRDATIGDGMRLSD